MGESKNPNTITASSPAPAAEATQEKPLMLRFLGMGLFITWLSCTHISLIFPGVSMEAGMRSAFDVGMRVGDLSTFVVLALAARSIGLLSARRVALWAFTILCSLGTLVVGLWVLPTAIDPLPVFLISIVTAIGGAFLFCLWGQIYSALGKTKVIFYGALSCVGAFCVSAVIFAMREPFAIWATALMPSASLACAFSSLRIVPKERPADKRQHYPLPWKLFAIMATGGLISGVSGAFMPSVAYMGSIHRIGATGLFGVLTLVFLTSHKRDHDARSLAYFAIPLALVSLALIPFAHGHLTYLVSLCAKLAFVFFTFFILLIMSRIVHRFSLPSLRLFALTRFFTELPLLIGVLMQRWLAEAQLIDNLTVRIVLCLGGIALLLLCVLIWKSEKSVNSDWGAAGVVVGVREKGRSHLKRMQKRLAELAERFELTKREQEVIALVAQGKTRAQIEAELFLSENTVKTHLRHAYKKLGVSSKEEVQALFDE